MSSSSIADVDCWGVVYVRTLRWPADPNDVLIGTSYCGQAVRAVCTKYPTVQAVAEARWAEEDAKARRGDGGDISFMEVLRMYGHDAFENEVVQWRRGPRSEMQAWADATERAAIAANGGTVRDLNPAAPIRQTFNVLPGGKGGDRFWYGRDAWSAKSWNRFRDALLQYVAKHGTSYVPKREVCHRTGYRIGAICTSVRNEGVMLHTSLEEEERRAWLNALPGWQWDYKHSEEYRTKCRERMHERLANWTEDKLSAIADKAIATKRLPEKRELAAEKSRRSWEDKSSATNLKRSASQKATKASPEYVAKIGAVRQEVATVKRQRRIEDAAKTAVPDPGSACRVVNAYYWNAQNELCIAQKDGQRCPKLRKLDDANSRAKMRAAGLRRKEAAAATTDAKNLLLSDCGDGE